MGGSHVIYFRFFNSSNLRVRSSKSMSSSSSFPLLNPAMSSTGTDGSSGRSGRSSLASKVVFRFLRGLGFGADTFNHYIERLSLSNETKHITLELIFVLKTLLLSVGDVGFGFSLPLKLLGGILGGRCLLTLLNGATGCCPTCWDGLKGGSG